MKQTLLAITFLATAPLVAAADVSKEDIKKLVAAGISDDVVLTYIRTHGPVAKLTSDDLVELKKAGASERILGAVAGDSTAAPTAEPSIPQTRIVEKVVEKPVYVPRTTYVYDNTPVYYSTYTYPTYSSYSYSTYCGPTYYSSYRSYPRYRYSSYPRYSGVYYRSGSRYCGPRYGVSVGFGW